MFRTWWQKFFSFPHSRFARRRGYRPPNQLLFRTTRLSMTALEDRITPAFNLTLSTAATVGVTSATVAGTTTFMATATGANLNWFDIQNAMAAGDNVVVNSGSGGTEAGNITDQSGAELSFAVPNLSLTIQSGSGSGLVGNITIEGLDLNATNTSLVISAQGSVETGLLTSGDFDGSSPAPLASLQITAATGSIGVVPSNPFPDLLDANTLSLQAATGIGASGTPIPTQVTNLEAQTGIGGVFITNDAANPGPLFVGGVSAALNGVQVTGASGDIDLVNSGRIEILTDGDTVRGPGNVTVQAIGASSDIQTGGQATSLLSSIRGLGNGVVTVEAGRDILLGDAAVPGPGSVRSVNGSIVLTAGRNITVNADAVVNVIGGAGSITAAAGGDITLLTAPGTEVGAPEIFTAGGDIDLTTGRGHTFTADSTGTDAVSSAGGNITVSADDMTINKGINAGTGTVTLQQAGLNTQAIDLGLGTTLDTLGLSNAELALVTAGTLRIGRTDNAGNITITAPIPTEAGFSTLSLISGGSIAEAASTDTITVTNLAVRAATGINLNTVVMDLAVRNTTSGNVSIANTGAATLTAVDNLDGSAGNQQGNFGGATTFTAASPFTYAITYTSAGTITTTTTDDGPVDTDNITVNSGVTVTSTGGDVVFDAGDDVVINGTVQSLARDVDLVAGFGDTDNEGVITINGTVSAVATVALNVNSTDTALPANTPIATETAASTISAAGLLLLNLPVGAPGPFNLNASATNAVGTIAASTNAAVNFRNAGALTIGSVTSTPEGVTSDGILTNNHAVSIQAGGTITVAKELNAGTAAATLNSTGGDILQAGTLATTGVAGGAVSLTATGAGGINLQVVTSTPATAGVTATTTNAPIILTSTQQLQVDNINAGTGDVTLHVTSANTAASSITSLHPNDNVADVTGHTVTLTADGASSGNTGQIGFFTASAQFFEVAATTLNASTNNSRAWISLIGGAAIGSVNVGTNTAFLRTFNGTLTSTHTGTTPDITAAAVNLSMSPAATSGQFGTPANPLLTQTSTLTAVVGAGPGSINVTNVAAGGNLAVVSAKTVSGPINLAVNGGNLTITAAAGSDISAPGSTVTLAASGAIISGTPAGVTDVSAANLALISGAGIGSVANPLKTVVTNLAFNNSGGVVDVANTGALTINAVGALLTSSNTGTTTILSAASPMTFAVNTTSAGTLTATTADNGGAGVDNITVNSGVTVQSTGGDVIFHSGDDVDVNGTVQSTFRDVDLVAGFGDTDGEGIINIAGTVSAVATVALNVNATNAALPAGTPIANETATGTITAAGLLLLNTPAGAPGEFSVDSSTTNSVGTIAATTNAEIDFQNSGALTVGSVTSTPEGVTSFGILTNNHDVTLCALTGDISLTQTLNAGTGTARLAAGGAVTQTAAGAITAANLGVAAGGNIGLDQAANAVPGTVALNSTGGSVAFMETDGFTVGTITASDCFPGATGITGGADITICSGLGITLTAPIHTTGTVRIQSGGSVTQTAAGTITAANLGVRADGNINLCVSGAANDITGTFAADASGGPAGSSVMFLDGSGYTVGTITASGCFTADAVGVRSNNGAVDLVNTAGSFAFDEPINAGTVTVRINSAGAVTQANNGVATITAANLAVIADGVINLCVAVSPNAVTGNFAAADSAAGAGIMFLDADGYTVGTVAGDACAAGATGAVSNNGDIDLVGFGPITLAQGVNASTGTVRLNAVGALTQTGAGVITAQNLAAVAGGNIDLSQLANAVNGTFAALNETAGNFIRFQDAPGFTVGTVAGDACAPGATGVRTTAADISLVSTAGPITLLQAVSTATPNIGTVRINSGGAVTQAVGGAGAITAASLAVVANGPVDLAEVPNTLNGTFAAADSANGAAVQFLDTNGFTVGTIAADPAALGATGVVTTNGDATLVSSTGSIQLQQAIVTGAGTTRLQAATGIASIAATGTVTAASLGVRNTTSGDIQLDRANAIGVLAAVNGATGAGINVADTIALTLDAVSADGTLFAALNDVTTTGTGGTVRLQTAGLSQTTNGIVSSDLLGVQNTSGDVILDQLNVVNTFAAANAAAGGRITLRNESSLVLGTVGSQGTFPTTNGITTNAGTTFLQAAGDVTQTAAGLVNSQALAVNSTVGGTIRLDQGNAVATFAAEEGPTSGLINFRTTVGLTLDTVTSGSALLPSIAGVSTRAGTTLLHAANGITQTATGLIDSATLAVRNDSAGDISLLQTNYITSIGNQVGTFAGINGGAGGRLDLATLGALTLGTVPGDGTFAQVRGITTNNGGSNLRSGTDFTAVDTNYASSFITLGSGNFLVNPGQTPVPAAMVNTVVRIVTFNAEAQTTGTFRFGVPKATDAPPPAPPINVPDQSPVPANPTGAATVPPAPDNPFRETFNIRPSANVQILVNGNDPTTAPGDTLNLILTDLASNAAVQFTPGGIGSGRFDFPNTRKAVPFTGIETVGGLSVLASSIQTGPHTYTVTASGTLQGRLLFGGISGGQAPANPFIVSPNPVNPVAPFGAARITFGDFNGDGITDLILANGPANAPLVTVVNGRALFGPQHALGISDILSQFFAYNPNFQGGMFVAAGDLNGDGRAEIVTGADQGGGPHVRVFSFNPAGTSIYNNAVDYATTFANPANSPFPNGGFYAYNSAFTGGVRVAVGDVNGDGKPDIITGAGPGGGPHVEVFSGANGKIIDSFYAFAPNFAGGVYVAAGDYNKDGKADILTGAGRGGPEVRVFSGADLSVLTQFYAFGPDGPPSLFGADLGDTTGVGSVAFADVNGDGIPDIVVGSNRGPRTRIAAFLGNAVSPPPHFTFTTATNPNPNLFTIDPTTGDLLTLPSFGLRDGSNVAGLFGTA